LWDKRFGCVAPDVKLSRFVVANDSTSLTNTDRRAVLEATISLDKGLSTLASFYGIPNMSRIPVRCILSKGEAEPVVSRNMSICVIPGAVLAGTRVEGTPVYLLLNVTAPRGQRDWYASTWNGPLKAEDNSISPNHTIFSAKGPWTTAGFVKGSSFEGLSISITACVATRMGRNANIDATGGMEAVKGSLEAASANSPRLTSRGFYENATDKTWWAGRQLGATQDKYDESARGVLNFRDPDFSMMDIAGIRDADMSSFLPTFAISRDGVSDASEITNPCGTFSFISPPRRDIPRSMGNPSLVSLFMDTIEETDSPARAMQTLYTVILMQRFYDSLGQANFTAYAMTVSSINAFVPCGVTGFSFVVGMVIVHLSLVALTTVLFRRHTHHTILGNSWQSVAQITWDATVPILEKAAGLTDREAEAMINQFQGGTRRRYRISCSNDGRRELTLAT